ncbi:23S rRNA (guanosine-2'-O-) -methyltransferase rlmB [hydrothermal vent metagenome]|uniref:23S rRNA (Guanosine-2'-O-) -methyltransferase rlmB n=1 Tax=hydrothermal vent metagenome TaxID=652676 RepID=A0A3B1DMK6_9ZZZZ
MRLFGKNSIIERIRANPRSIQKMYVQSGSGVGAYARKKLKPLGTSVLTVPPSKILKIARNKNTQGVVAVVEDFLYTPYEELLEVAVKKRRCLLFFDELKDPQNFGAIIRSIACFGKFSIILPKHDSVSVTETVLRVASGGDNYVPISRVSNLNQAIKKAKNEDFQIAGAVVKGGASLEEIKLPPLLGLVIGSEQKGIRETVRKNLDLELTIPMSVETLSFNVAQATTVLCYEVVRQRLCRKKV